MAADRSRLAAALAYKQAEEERRRRMMESVPGLVTDPAQPALRADFRTNLENLSIGLGEGLTNQLEGVKSIITDPVGTARGVYETGRAVIRDPSVIADALRYTAQQATSGPLGAGEVIGEMLGPRKGGPVMQELDVYHGTPHKFPATEANPLGEFDASKIGTGEGAQAYGHGVYLAESPDIAKHYQTQLGKFYDQMQTPEGAMSLEEAVTKYHPDGKAAAKVLSTFRTKTDVDTFNKVINDEILPEIRAKYPQSEWDKFAPQQGTLYKADLPDEMIDRMLDWDKPLSEQPAVLAAIKNLPEVKTLTERGQKFENLTGQNFYKLISDSRSHGYRDASSGFKSAGIPGIKYLDAGSRGQGGSGTRNFVVFPGEEKKVRILERK
jgi:hypothetical protein